MEQVVQALLGTFNLDVGVRGAAELSLAQMATQAGFFPTLLQLVTESEFTANARLSGAIFLKNGLRGLWEGGSWTSHRDVPAAPLASDADRGHIRDMLVEAVVTTTGAVQRQLLQIIEIVSRHDFPEAWPNALEQVRAQFASGAADRIFGAVSCVRALLDSFEYTGHDNERRPILEQLVAEVFPALLELQQQLVGQAASAHTLETYRLLEVLTSCVAVSVTIRPAQYLQQPAVLDAWMGALLPVLRGMDVPELYEDDPVFPLWRAKRHVAAFLLRLLQRWCNPAICDDDMHGFREHLTNAHTRPVLETALHVLSGIAHGHTPPESVLMKVLRIVEEGVSLPPAFKTLKPHLNSILFDMLLPLLCFTEKDQELWEDDPSEYIATHHEERYGYIDIKYVALSVLVSLVQVRTSMVLPSVLETTAQVINGAAQSPQDETLARQKFGAYKALAGIATKLMKPAMGLQDQLEALLTGMVPDFASPFPFLRSAALDMFTSFAILEFSNVNTQRDIVAGVLQCVNDPELPVQVHATISLRYVFLLPAGRELVKPHLGDLLMRMLEVMSHAKSNTYLLTALEALIVQFPEDIAPHAVGLIQQLVNMAAESLRLLTELDNIDIDDYDEENAPADPNDALAQNLSNMYVVCESVQELPEVVAQLQVIMFPMFEQLVQPMCIELVTGTMDLINFFLFVPQTITPQMWTLFDPIYDLFDRYTGDWIRDYVPVWDNYATMDSAQFLSDPTRLPRLLQAVEKFIVVETERYDEQQAAHAAKLAEVLLLNLLGDLDDALPTLVGMAAQRLSGNVSFDGLTVGLLHIFSAAMRYDVDLFLGALAAQPGMADVVFAGYMTSFDKMHTSYDLKLTVLGFLALLGRTAWSNLPALLQQNMPAVLTALVDMSVRMQQSQQAEAEADARFLNDDQPLNLPSMDEWTEEAALLEVQELGEDEWEDPSISAEKLDRLREMCAKYAMDDEAEMNVITPIDGLNVFIEWRAFLTSAQMLQGDAWHSVVAQMGEKGALFDQFAAEGERVAAAEAQEGQQQ